MKACRNWNGTCVAQMRAGEQGTKVPDKAQRSRTRSKGVSACTVPCSDIARSRFRNVARRCRRSFASRNGGETGELYFAGCWDPDDEDVRTERAGLPVLENAAVVFVTDVEQEIDPVDHILFGGRPNRVNPGGRNALTANPIRVPTAEPECPPPPGRPISCRAESRSSA